MVFWRSGLRAGLKNRRLGFDSPGDHHIAVEHKTCDLEKSGEIEV